jgi:HK97 family phage major capsid protein
MDSYFNEARVSELETQREEIAERLNTLLDQAGNENRELSRREAASVRELERQVEDLDDEIGRQRALPQPPQRQIRDTFGGAESSRPALVLAPEQRMADAWQRRRPSQAFTEEDQRDFSLGRYVRGIVTGSWEDAELERRALAEGTNSAGGFLTPEPLATTVIDRIRNQARVIQAGARTVGMESDTMAIPRLATGVTGTWRNENTAVNESDPVFERVTFTARTLAVLTRLSYELFQDMTPAGADIIETELIQALAVELDRVALRGSGTPPEPKGVKNQTGVTTITNGTNGGAMSWDMLVTAAATVEANGFNPNAAIVNPRATRSLALLKDNNLAYLAPPSYLSNLNVLVTQQIPTNVTTGSSTDTSELYVAQWDQLLIGFRPQVSISVERTGGPSGMIGVKSSQDRYIDTMQIGLLAFLRADIQLGHPEAFVVSTGVRP